jgi:hypothetical protein
MEAKLNLRLGFDNLESRDPFQSTRLLPIPALPRSRSRSPLCGPWGVAFIHTGHFNSETFPTSSHSPARSQNLVLCAGIGEVTSAIIVMPHKVLRQWISTQALVPRLLS